MLAVDDATLPIHYRRHRSDIVLTIRHIHMEVLKIKVGDKQKHQQLRVLLKVESIRNRQSDIDERLVWTDQMTVFATTQKFLAFFVLIDISDLMGRCSDCICLLLLSFLPLCSFWFHCRMVVVTDNLHRQFFRVCVCDHILLIQIVPLTRSALVASTPQSLRLR